MVLLKFGITNTRTETFAQLNARSMSFIIPGILLGHYLDKSIAKLELNTKHAVALQTFLNIAIIFTINKISFEYAKEFQITFAGLFFSSLYFGMQTKYIENIKSILK